MTPEINDALRAGHALGYLDAALDLLTLYGAALVAFAAWSAWRWRQGRWRG